MPFESTDISQDLQKWSLNSDEKVNAMTVSYCYANIPMCECSCSLRFESFRLILQSEQK